MFYDAERQLKTAEVLPGCRYHKDGAGIIRELLKKGFISKETYYDLVGIEIGDKLLETNVFAFHINSGEITFPSTVMKRFCEEKVRVWQGQITLASLLLAAHVSFRIQQDFRIRKAGFLGGGAKTPVFGGQSTGAHILGVKSGGYKINVLEIDTKILSMDRVKEAVVEGV